MSGSDDALERRIQSSHARLEEIQKRRRALRWIKLSIPLAALVIIFTGLWLIWSSARTNVVDRKDELATAFQDRAGQTNLADRLERDAKKAAERVMPVIQSQLQKAQDKLGATLPSALEKASKDLEPRVRTHMEEALNKALSEVRARQAELLMANFGQYINCRPGAPEEECKAKRNRTDKLLEDITAEYHEVAIVQTTIALNAHLNALGDIHDAVSGLAHRDPAAAAAAQRSAARGAAPTDMLMIFVEAVGESLGGNTEAFGGQGPQLDEADPDAEILETSVRQVGPDSGAVPTPAVPTPAEPALAVPTPAEPNPAVPTPAPVEPVPPTPAPAAPNGGTP
jgi:hypothetical protein